MYGSSDTAGKGKVKLTVTVATCPHGRDGHEGLMSEPK